MEKTTDQAERTPWNKGVIVGQKSPFKLKEILAITCGRSSMTQKKNVSPVIVALSVMGDVPADQIICRFFKSSLRAESLDIWHSGGH